MPKRSQQEVRDKPICENLGFTVEFKPCPSSSAEEGKEGDPRQPLRYVHNYSTDDKEPGKFSRDYQISFEATCGFVGASFSHRRVKRWLRATDL